MDIYFVIGKLALCTTSLPIKFNPSRVCPGWQLLEDLCPLTCCCAELAVRILEASQLKPMLWGGNLPSFQLQSRLCKSALDRDGWHCIAKLKLHTNTYHGIQNWSHISSLPCLHPLQLHLTKASGVSWIPKLARITLVIAKWCGRRWR